MFPTSAEDVETSADVYKPAECMNMSADVYKHQPKVWSRLQMFRQISAEGVESTADVYKHQLKV